MLEASHDYVLPDSNTGEYTYAEKHRRVIRITQKGFEVCLTKLRILIKCIPYGRDYLPRPRNYLL